MAQSFVDNPVWPWTNAAAQGGAREESGGGEGRRQESHARCSSMRFCLPIRPSVPAQCMCKAFSFFEWRRPLIAQIEWTRFSDCEQSSLAHTLPRPPHQCLFPPLPCRRLVFFSSSPLRNQTDLHHLQDRENQCLPRTSSLIASSQAPLLSFLLILTSLASRNQEPVAATGTRNKLLSSPASLLPRL